MTFPIGAWTLLTNEDMTLNELMQYTKDYCLLIQIEITDIKIKKGVTFPFAQYDKLYKGKQGYTKFITDNGRVLQMDGKSIINCTELDLQILMEQYTFKSRIIKAYCSKRGYLPHYIIDTVDYFFQNKTHYKEIVEELQEKIHNDFDIEVLNAIIDLMKSKNGLNAIYGCCATDIVRNEITMNINGEFIKEILNDDLIQEKLNKYFSNPKSCLPYAVGIWCTSSARYELYEFIKTIGYENCIYCDTDSIFYFSNNEIEKRIENLNKKKNENAQKINAFIETEKGTKVYYDNFKLEKEDIIKFRFLHSKCYCYIEKDNNSHLVIAGVTALSKDKKINRMQELGNIENLKEGFTFIACGGTLSKYLENKPHIEYINGHEIELASACVILDNTKTLNDKEEQIDIDYVEMWEVTEI